MTKKSFQKLIYDYYHRFGRHDLPWRETTDPYKIMVSEIMLQQTQVDRVIPKYQNFLKLFPNPKALAQASTGEILKAWQGLGYNRRALNLQKAAKEIVAHYNGKMPSDYEALLDLPGIGPYTASAVRAFAFNLSGVFIETNIRTVFLHEFFKDKKNIHDKNIMQLIQETQDNKNPREWYWALMDYGTFLKKKYGNANKASKHYTKQSKFEGSLRQVRGAIVKYLVQSHKGVSVLVLQEDLSKYGKRFNPALATLLKDGLVVKKGQKIRLP